MITKKANNKKGRALGPAVVPASSGANVPHDTPRGTRVGVFTDEIKQEMRRELLVRNAPPREVLVEGKQYFLDFDFAKLVDAEQFFIAAGNRDVSLLFSLSPATLTVGRLQALIACAAHTHHPDLTFEQGRRLVTPESLYPLLNAVYDVLMPRTEPGESVADGKVANAVAAGVSE